MLKSIARVRIHKIKQSACKAINYMKIVIETVKKSATKAINEIFIEQ